MFGLPMSTTLIMSAIMAFWVVYTLVFYFSTTRWAIEDADYAPAEPESDPSLEVDGTSPRNSEGGELR